MPGAGKSALFSPDRRYRYVLGRDLPAGRGGVCLFIMLNPGTADDRVDDPTIRRCMRFAAAWGFGRLAVVNLFAFRSPDPGRLLRAAHPVGPDNDRWIAATARRSTRIVAAWGTHPLVPERSRAVLRLLKGRRLLALGRNKDGTPRHPLYLRSGTRLSVYRKGD